MSVKYNLILELQRNLDNALDVKVSPNYKKGFKKYKNDKRVAEPMKELISLLKYNKEVPQKFNDHALKGGHMENVRTAHIKGQQIVLLYKIDHTGLYLLHLGTHKDIGTM